MKKVLSVMLAAAMVMGMSVTSMAKTDKEFFAPATSENNDAAVSEMHFKDVTIEGECRNGCCVKADHVLAGEDYSDLVAGDVLWFPVYINDEQVEGTCDADWVIKINNAEYVKKAEFKTVDGKLFVKVTLEDDFNSYEEAIDEEVCDFWFYIYNKETKEESLDKAVVEYTFREYKEIAVTEVDELVEIYTCEPVIYELEGYKTSKEVVFVTADNGEYVYMTARMYPGKEYLTDVYYDADLSEDMTQAYDEVVEVLHVESKMLNGIIFDADGKEDDHIVVEVKGDKLVEVASEFETKYEVLELETLSHCYILTKNIDGDFALVSDDLDVAEIVPESEKIEVEVKEDTTSTEKTNPETGANDFVGAAVAMAVVSVAAAGALALKK